MIELIKEALEVCMIRTKGTKFNMNTLSFILITRFNKKSLAYSFIARNYLRTFINVATNLGYITYDIDTQIITINENNDDMAMLMAKNGIKFLKNQE